MRAVGDCTCRHIFTLRKRLEATWREFDTQLFVSIPIVSPMLSCDHYITPLHYILFFSRGGWLNNKSFQQTGLDTYRCRVVLLISFFMSMANKKFLWSYHNLGNLGKVTRIHLTMVPTCSWQAWDLWDTELLTLQTSITAKSLLAPSTASWQIKKNNQKPAFSPFHTISFSNIHLSCKRIWLLGIGGN